MKVILIYLMLSGFVYSQGQISVLSQDETRMVVLIENLLPGQRYELSVREAEDNYTFTMPQSQQFYNKAILISVDGLRADAVSKNLSRLPSFNKLYQNGLSTFSARTDLYSTETLPNHTGIVTGKFSRGDHAHGWTKNGDPGNNFIDSEILSIFDRIENNAVFSRKDKIRKLFGNSFPLRINYQGTQRQNTDSLIRVFPSIEFGFIHYGKPDSVGHKTSFNTDWGSTYLNAIAEVDGFIGDIINALPDNTLLIVTTDHGGGEPVPNQHYSSQEALNYTIPIFIYDGRLQGNLQDYNQELGQIHSMHVANLILEQLGKVKLAKSLDGLKIKQ